MNVRGTRLVLGIFFAGMAVVLFFRETLLPDLANNPRMTNLGFGAWFALALAGWNLARWYVDWAAAPAGPPHRPIRPRGGTGSPDEPPNPDFDFSDSDRPPAGGERRG